MKRKSRPESQKKRDSGALYESKTLSWENLLEIDEVEFDFPGEDFGLDFPINALEDHRKQNQGTSFDNLHCSSYKGQRLGSPPTRGLNRCKKKKERPEK